MGKNYYAMVIPTSSDKMEIIEAVVNNDLEFAKDKIVQFTEKIHIGKSSAGWEFLFNLNSKKYYSDIDTLKDFISHSNVIIYDEYDTQIFFLDFWTKVVKNRMFNGQPAKKNTGYRYIQIDGYSFFDGEFF